SDRRGRRQSPGRRRADRHPARPSHRDGLSGPGSRRQPAGRDRRCPPDRDELSRFLAIDGPPRRAFHRGWMRATRPFVVAIDGPAASGKGTLARRLAERFGLAHLDTGKLYRATASLVLATGADPADAKAAATAARQIDPARLAEPALLGE